MPLMREVVTRERDHERSRRRATRLGDNNERRRTENMKAVIYARTATTEQAEHGSSLPAQIEACRKYAKDNGFEVAEVFADAGYSGAKLDRPALKKMRDLIARGSISAVVISDPARLTRSITDMPLLESEFAKKGAHLHDARRGAVRPIPIPVHVRRHKRMRRG